MTALCAALAPELPRWTERRCSGPTATCGSPRTRRRTRPTRARSSPPARRPGGTSRSPREGVRVGAGFYEATSGERLAAIRAAIDDDSTGPKLERILAQLETRTAARSAANGSRPARAGTTPTTRGSSCCATSRCSPGSSLRLRAGHPHPRAARPGPRRLAGAAPAGRVGAPAKRGVGLLLAVGRHRPLGLPVRPHRGDPTLVVDRVDHHQVGVDPAAVGERRGDGADVGARRCRWRGSRGSTNRNDSIGAIASSQKARIPSWPRWPLPLGVEHRRPDRVLDHRVLGVHRQPLLQVARGDRGVRALRGGAGGVLAVGRVPGDGVRQLLMLPILEHVLCFETVAGSSNLGLRRSRSDRLEITGR